MINCAIRASDKTIVYKNLAAVTLPAFFGQMQVLPDHAEAFVLLKKGDIVLQKAQARQKQDNIQILSGECYIKDNTVDIIL